MFYFVEIVQDALLDQVPDVQRSWIKKLFGFTVLKPTERSVIPRGTNMLMLVSWQNFAFEKSPVCGLKFQEWTYFVWLDCWA